MFSKKVQEFDNMKEQKNCIEAELNQTLLERDNLRDCDKKLKRAQAEISKLREHIDLLNNDNKLRIQQFEMNLDQINTEKRQMIEKNMELSNQVNALCSELESEQYAN